MNKRFCLKKTVLLILLITCVFGAYSEAKRSVVFFGAVSSSQDTATIKLTEDLYYSQMLALSSLSVKNRRDIVWNPSIANEYESTDSILFHAEIQEKNSGWQCTLTALDMQNGLAASKTIFYEGYYKILMDAKNSLLSLFDHLEDGTGTAATESQAEAEGFSEALSQISLEQLAGNWSGDSYITKIVIQKTGRGFVIFKNGATMNITVSLSGTTVTAQQASGSNASFFPELPREVALKSAKSASPITWTLQITDWNTLSGTKLTLGMDESGTSPVEQAVPTIWTRQ